MERMKKRVVGKALGVVAATSKPGICGITGCVLRLEAAGAAAKVAAIGDSAPI